MNNMDFNSGGAGDVEGDHSMHLAPHPHHFNAPQSASAAQFVSPFRHHAVSPIAEHPMEAGAARLHPAANLMPQDAHTAVTAQHVPQGYYQESPRPAPALTPSTPSTNASPRFANITPGQSRPAFQNSVPTNRSLPSRDVTDETIADTYAAFILYCNPSFQLNTDTNELKKAFRTPPKSEGKSFSIYTLYDLIRRLDAKEIKTWTELALELGVERPDVEKGQSTQKVQQYTVRLKRWMRALHIDAFFEYLIGKNPPYCRQIPPVDAPYPDQRDAVPIEEDLAIRALDPKFRPKRGRRKADEQDEDMEPGSAVDPKRPHLDTSVAFGGISGYPQSANPTSAMGMSAHPDDLMHGVDPWATAGLTPAGQMKPSQHVRWRVGSQDPQTPHPMSAITPISAQPPDSVFDEPTSAVTPSSKTKKRRHGPAVSSAWPSSNTTSNGRLRGRPPSNRSVRDGPFVTFPANPTAKEQTIDISRNKSSPEATRAVIATQSIQQNPTPVSATPPQHQPPAPQTRPERLQLQVPQHVGGPVHLVTPTVLVNGEMSPPQPPAHLPSASTATSTRSGATAMSFFSSDSSIPGSTTTADTEHTFLTPRSGVTQQGTPLRVVPMHQVHPQSGQEKTVPQISNEDLKRALAADLLRGDITGRGGKRLRGSEAKELAECLLSRLRSQSPDLSSSGSANDTFNLACASWLGLSNLIALQGGAAGTAGVGLNFSGGTKRIYVQRFRIGRDGYDSPIDEDDDVPDGRSTAAAEAEGEIRETFDVEWSSSLGGLSGQFSVKALSIGGRGGEEEDEAAGRSGSGRAGRKASGPVADENASAGVWKQRYLAAERKLRESREEVGRLRDRVLEVVL